MGGTTVVALNQIDKQRLVKRLGVLKPATISRVDQALRVSIGLTKI